MKKTQGLILSTLLMFLITLSSCEAIKGIFKAGMWTGIIIVALIVGLILYFVGKVKK